MLNISNLNHPTIQQKLFKARIIGARYVRRNELTSYNSNIETKNGFIRLNFDQKSGFRFVYFNNKNRQAKEITGNINESLVQLLGGAA